MTSAVETTIETHATPKPVAEIASAEPKEPSAPAPQPNAGSQQSPQKKASGGNGGSRKNRRSGGKKKSGGGFNSQDRSEFASLNQAIADYERRGDISLHEDLEIDVSTLIRMTPELESKSAVFALAARYPSIQAFYEAAPSVYVYVFRNGWLNELMRQFP